MIIKQLSVFVENASGRLTGVTGVLADAGINMSAFTLADTAEYGVLRMIVNKPEEAKKVLEENDYSVHLTDVIGLVVPDEPGGLHRALKFISAEGISIEYMYAFSLNNRATVIIRTDALQETISTLQHHKLELVKASEIYEI